MAKISRIRWTAEEQSAVIAAAKELVATGNKMSVAERLAKAQSVLPKNRRRPPSANLSTWLSKSIAGVPVAPKARAPAAGSIKGAESNLTAALIAAGASILKGILADAGVKKALKQALK
jgi:hypothetical protein